MYCHALSDSEHNHILPQHHKMYAFLLVYLFLHIAMIMSAVCVMLSFIRGPYAFYFATFLAFIFGKTL